MLRMPIEEQELIPTYKTLESSLRRARMRTFPVCRNLLELSAIMSDKERMEPINMKEICKLNNEWIYKGKVQTRHDVALIFINPYVHDEATRASNVSVDGTFKTPLKCAQVLNIFREVDNVVSLSYV